MIRGASVIPSEFPARPTPKPTPQGRSFVERLHQKQSRPIAAVPRLPASICPVCGTHGFVVIVSGQISSRRQCGACGFKWDMSANDRQFRFRFE